MKPISFEIRELIVLAKMRKEKNLEIAKWFNISESSVEQIWRLHQRAGSVEPKTYTGRKSSITSEMIDSIRNIIRGKPDTTLEEMKTDLELPIEKSQLANLLRRLGYTYKKKLYILKTN